MAKKFHSKKTFAKMAGLSTRELAVYINREKVIVEADGIDREHPTNKGFLEARKKHGKTAKESQKHFQRIGELEVTHKARQTEKLQTEIEILKAKKEKLTGELIPIQPVKDTLQLFSKHIMISFRDLIDSKLMEHSRKLKLNRNEIFEVKSDFAMGINSSMETARKNALKDLKTICSRYGN